MDPAHVSFKDGAWIQTAGGGQLGPHNVMAYFAQSQFYDRTCNNEVAAMQTQFGAAGATAGDALMYAPSFYFNLAA